MQATDTEEAPRPDVRIVASRIGSVEVPVANLLTFPRGLLGFDGRSDFAVLNLPRAGMERFKLLQSVDDAELGFVVTEAVAAADVIDPSDLQDAYKQCEVRPSDALTLLIVAIRRTADGVEMSANLRAPIIIDAKRRIGRQHIMANGRYPIRFTL